MVCLTKREVSLTFIGKFRARLSGLVQAYLHPELFLQFFSTILVCTFPQIRHMVQVPHASWSSNYHAIFKKKMYNF